MRNLTKKMFKKTARKLGLPNKTNQVIDKRFMDPTIIFLLKLSVK